MVLRLFPSGAHPKGLATLAMVEMWERFAFYGARAILVLFLTAPKSSGGLGMPDSEAVALYGLYTAGALLMGLVGGWFSDRVVGARRAVAIGGILIVAGNLLITIGAYNTILPLVYLGLFVDATGVGFLKPNASAMVAGLYPESGARRDAGFSLFFVGIQLGSLGGALLVPLFASLYGWWFGFCGTIVGMSFGLTFYLRSQSGLKSIGEVSQKIADDSWRRLGFGFGAVAITAIVSVGFLLDHGISIEIAQLSRVVSILMGVVFVGVFVYLVGQSDLDRAGRNRLLAMIPLCLAVAVYLLGYQQGGSSLSLFIQRYTDKSLAGVEIPAGMFQSCIPIFTILLAPAFALLWLRLSSKGWEPSSSIKFGCALIMMGAGFLVMSLAADRATEVGGVGPGWIVGTFLLQSIADLCIAPIGLSATSKLAPKNRVGQTMGLWFMATAVGNSLSGVVAGYIPLSSTTGMSGGFFNIFLLGIVAGAIMIAINPIFVRLTGRGV